MGQVSFALLCADELEGMLPAGISICGAWAKQGSKQDAIQRLDQMTASATAKVVLQASTERMTLYRTTGHRDLLLPIPVCAHV